MAQITEQSLNDWPKADHTPKNNGNRCSPEIETLIIHLVKDDFEASWNLTAKHASVITGESVSADLVQRVRERHSLEKPSPPPKKQGKVRSNYSHTVSIDVVREEGSPIFGFIQDKTKVSYHFKAEAHTAEQAVIGLKNYIEQFGKPDAIRCDNGSEFKKEFQQFVKDEKIHILNPRPYNPKANGFIERYFRTLRKDLFRKLKKRKIEVTQAILDEYSLLWNFFRTVGKTGKTPAELAGIPIPEGLDNTFEIEKVSVASWTFWHIRGIHGLLHAYVREDRLQIQEQNSRQKVA